MPSRPGIRCRPGPAREVLARGGNACDALVAAVLASWVCEPTVSGACGGGFLLHRSAAGRVDLLDFFAAAPGLGLKRPVQPMESFEVEFGTAVQRFHIGAGSVAVPGTAAGLGAAHRQFGIAAVGRAGRAGGARWPGPASSRPRRTRA